MYASISLSGKFRVMPDDDASKTFDAKDTASVTFHDNFRVIKVADAPPAETVVATAE